VIWTAAIDPTQENLLKTMVVNMAAMGAKTARVYDYPRKARNSVPASTRLINKSSG